MIQPTDPNSMRIMINKLGERTPVEASEILLNHDTGSIYLRLTNGLTMCTHPLIKEEAGKTFMKISRGVPIWRQLFKGERYVELFCERYEWITAIPRI